MSGIPNWAYQGAKVVCWTEKYFSGDRPHPRPREVCTIEATGTLDGWPIFKLVEYRHRFIGMVFRPAAPPRTQDQDIAEHFKSMLDQPRREVVRIPHLGEVR